MGKKTSEIFDVAPTGKKAAAATVGVAQPANNNFDKLKELVKGLNKHYKGEIIKTGDKIAKVQKIRVGEPMLDFITDGGIPVSRLTEFIGAEHSGKTRNALIVLGMSQKFCFSCFTNDSLDAVWADESQKAANEKGFPKLLKCTCTNCKTPKTLIGAFIDLEGTSDPLFVERFGVDLKGIIYNKPELPSTAVDIVDSLLKNTSVGLIVMDSVGSMGSDKEVTNAIVDDKMNQNALFLNKAVRKWQMSLNANTNEEWESGTTMIVINQSYSTIGNYATEVAQGGRGLRHGKSMSVKTRISEKTYNNDRSILEGVHITVTNEKNKTGMPYRKGTYYLNLNPFSDGEYCKADVPMQLVELAILLGVVSQSGAWVYFLDGTTELDKWNGRNKFIEAVKLDADLQKEISKRVYAKMGI